jgi:hypothetical protein
MFNAAVINLETGVQEAGDTVNYQSLEDGVSAMDDLVRKLTGQKTQSEEAAAAAELETVRARAEEAARAQAETARVQAEAARTQTEAAAKLKDQAEWESIAAQARAGRLVVRDAASFTQAIAAINNDMAGDQYTVTLNGSFASNPVAFTGNATKTITIKGDARVRTISNNGGGSLFSVPAGISLVLGNNITLNGNNQKYIIVNINGGTLVMKNGSTVRGAQASGVYVVGGAFTMSGGTINGNSASFGGGVVVSSGASFTMSGGTISGNTSPSGGGGVDVSSGASFTMSGGTISGNTASSSRGGGVYVSGILTMTGVTISGNTASSRSGGGVNVSGI